MKLIFGGAYQGKLEYALSLIESDSEKETKVNKDSVKLKQSEKNNSAGANTLVYSCPDIRTCASPEECLAALDPVKAISAMKPAPVIIDHLERMVYALIDAGIDPVEYVQKNIELLRGNTEERILIIEDISQGVVPIDTKERAWREANGRVMALLAKEATSVIRVFCGIPQQLK